MIDLETSYSSLVSHFIYTGKANFASPWSPRYHTNSSGELVFLLFKRPQKSIYVLYLQTTFDFGCSLPCAALDFQSCFLCFTLVFCLCLLCSGADAYSVFFYRLKCSLLRLPFWRDYRKTFSANQIFSFNHVSKQQYFDLRQRSTIPLRL